MRAAFLLLEPEQQGTAGARCILHGEAVGNVSAVVSALYQVQVSNKYLIYTHITKLTAF